MKNKTTVNPIKIMDYNGKYKGTEYHKYLLRKSSEKLRTLDVNETYQPKEWTKDTIEEIFPLMRPMSDYVWRQTKKVMEVMGENQYIKCLYEWYKDSFSVTIPSLEVN